MKRISAIFCLLFLIASLDSFGQNKAAQWFLTANGNFYIPIDNKGKGIYPILGYDKATSPKVLLGGAGLGAAMLKPLTRDLSFKAQANLSKHTYWDEPVLIRDYVANPVGEYQSGSSDLGLGLAGMIHYALIGDFSVGVGLSAQATVISMSHKPGMYIGTEIEPGFVVNHYYKTIVPMVPVELSYRHKKLLFNVRYEAGLINRLKGDLAQFKSDKFSLLTFEFGYRIK
jgi:hypothetical protein